MKFDLKNDFLPVGTVVSIRFNPNKFMIMGFCTIEGNTKKMYDYCAVLYPSGFTSIDETFMFNRDIVKKVHHLGYVTEEEKEFKKLLEDALKKKNNEMNE